MELPYLKLVADWRCRDRRELMADEGMRRHKIRVASVGRGADRAVAES